MKTPSLLSSMHLDKQLRGLVIAASQLLIIPAKETACLHALSLWQT